MLGYANLLTECNCLVTLHKILNYLSFPLRSCLGVTGLLLPRGRRVLGCLIIGLGKDINPNLRAGEMAQQVKALTAKHDN